MAQGKIKKFKTEVLKNRATDILDLERTIQKNIQVDDLSLKEMVNQSVDSIDFFAFKKKPDKKKKVPGTDKKQFLKSKAPLSGDGFILTLSNNLKIAENKLKELELENDKLRLDNEKFRVAGQTLKESLDKFSNENKALKSTYREDRLSWSDQKNDLENSVEEQSAEIKNLKMKINSLEKHLGRDIKKTRFRERELENRLDLKQNEIESVIRDKDQTLLKFKRELDILREKAESDRQNYQSWMNKKIQDKEHIGQVIQALRRSLKLLENIIGQEEEFILEEKSELFEKESGLESSTPGETSLKVAASASLELGGHPDSAKEDQKEDEDIEELSGVQDEAG